MKSHHFFLAASALALSASVLAAGSHANGSAHDAGDTAIGKPGVAAKATRTVQINMTDDMRFHADTIQAKRGETIRFVIKNSGALTHEMVLGTEKDLKDHYEVMKKNPEMEHADANMITLAPGKTGEIVWQFTKAGKVDFACLQPGHYDAGMRGQVNVSKQ